MRIRQVYTNHGNLNIVRQLTNNAELRPAREAHGMAASLAARRARGRRLHGLAALLLSPSLPRLVRSPSSVSRAGGWVYEKKKCPRVLNRWPADFGGEIGLGSGGARSHWLCGGLFPSQTCLPPPFRHKLAYLNLNSIGVSRQFILSTIMGSCASFLRFLRCRGAPAPISLADQKKRKIIKSTLNTKHST